MNGTFHLTMSPAPTDSTPAPRASPVARRLRLGDDVSAFWRLAITRRIVAHLPRPSLPPSAASKLLALFVALVALATANAATLQANLNGVVSSTYDTGSTTVTTEQGLSSALAGLDFTADVDYSSIETNHIATGLAPSASTSGYEWKTFSDYYGSSDAVWKTYVNKAQVSPDLKT